MKFLRRLFGLDFPDPQVGQVWRSEHSGRHIRVSKARVTDSGGFAWSFEHENADAGKPYPGRPDSAQLRWGIAQTYFGLDRWRRMLKQERRVLVGMVQAPKEKG